MASFTSTGGISLNAGGTQNGSSSVSVSGISGPVTRVVVTLNCLSGGNSNGINDYSFLVAAPGSSGPAFDFLNSTCFSASSATLTIADAETNQAPNGSTNCSYGNSAYAYKPFNASGVTDSFSANYSGSFTQAPPENPSGSFGVFQGLSAASANSTWNLYIDYQLGSFTDCSSGSCAAVSIANWTLSVYYSATAESTTTSLSGSSSSPFTTSPGNSVTLTATVNSTGTVSGGTVAFFDGGSQISCGGGNQTVSSGQATCITSFTTEGAHSLTAAYSGAGSFSGSNSDSNPLVITASNHTSQSGNQYCNNGTLTSGDIVTSPLPSNIFIGSPDSTTAPSGGGLISTVSVTLKSLSTGSGAGEEQQNLLLVGPAGGILLFDANGGTETVSQSLTSVGFADSGSTLAYDTAFSSSTTYHPLSYFNEEGESQTGQAAFPSGTPTFSAVNEAAPTGTATFESVYTGSGATGTWSLYYSSTGNGSSTVGGWCLNFTMTGGAATTTSVISGTPTALTTQSFSLTATVASATTGTVTFVATTPTGGSTTLGGMTVGSNGKATLSVPANTLTEGTYEITADFSDSSNTFGPSHGSVAQRMNNPSPTPTISGNTYTYCNTTPIVVPYTGAFSAPATAAPYPSNIIVSNLPGTLSALSVQLNLENNFNDTQNVASLLTGPTGANIDFFSNVGGFGASSGTVTYNIFDGAGSPFGQYTTSDFPPSGNYPPESYGLTTNGASDTFPACPALIGNCNSGTPVGPPAPSSGYNYATPKGSATFSSIFGSGSGNTYNANGPWSLYLYADVANDPLGTIGSWCVALTENAATVSVAESHSGSGASGGFVQGETGAQITTVVTNNGPGSTGDPSQGSNPLTVTDTLNSAFTYTGFSGSGWTCNTPPQTTVVCTNDAAIALGDAYPTLTLNVNVSNSAGSSISNQASVSGAGVTATNSNADSIPVASAPVLSVTKSHTGTFTQGQTATWTITVNNTASGSATSGTTTVTDTLPSGTNNSTAYGYTISGTPTGTGWTCSASTTTVVSCTSSQVVAGGASFYPITVTVNVPAASPTSVSNTASAYGGGDLNHTNSGNAISGSDSPTVVQVPATVTITAGGTQSALINTAFGTLTVLVKDGAGVAIPSQSVTFSAPGSGASGTFSNSTNTITGSTSSSTPVGQLSETFTANGTAGGPYNVSATAGSVSASPAFSLTNTTVPQVVSYSVDFGSQSYNLVGASRTTHLPWTVSAIKVTFSEAIATANVNSLSGISATGLSGLGTSTLTWTFTGITNATLSTNLAGSGANAIKDASGNALAGGSGFSQAFSVLYGDFSGDGSVTATDLLDVTAATKQSYNLFADINGDAVVTAADATIVKAQEGATQH